MEGRVEGRVEGGLRVGGGWVEVREGEGVSGCWLGASGWVGGVPVDWCVVSGRCSVLVASGDTGGCRWGQMVCGEWAMYGGWYVMGRGGEVVCEFGRVWWGWSGRSVGGDVVEVGLPLGVDDGAWLAQATADHPVFVHLSESL